LGRYLFYYYFPIWASVELISFTNHCGGRNITATTDKFDRQLRPSYKERGRKNEAKKIAEKGAEEGMVKPQR
jgi:hypothetical protein